MKIKIIPAILVKDKKTLQEYLKKAKKVSNYVHMDIMDGHFVRHNTISYLAFRGLKNIPSLEYHLMIKEPKKQIINYVPYCDLIIFHFESTKDVFGVIREIKKHDKKVGIAINPDTNLLNIIPYLSYLDKVLIMGVNSGRSGQRFIPSVLTKIKKLRKINKNIDICVDGGINDKTALKCIKAGASGLVVNSYLYNSDEIIKNYTILKRCVENAR